MAVLREHALSAVLEVVLDQTIRIMGARLALVHLLVPDQDRRVLVLAAHRHLPVDLAEKVARISFDAPALEARAALAWRIQAIASPGELDPALETTRELMSRTGCESMVALPLVARHRLVGVLSFGVTAPHVLAAEERDMLASCADIFAYAIANASLVETEQRHRALFEAVATATADIAAELALEPMLQRIVDEARGVVDAEYAALGLVVADDRPFEPWVWSGMTREQAQRIGRAPRPVGTLGAVAREGRTIRVPDVRADAAFRGLPEHHPPLTSFLAVPVHHEGRPMGNLYLANKRGATEFSAEDEKAIKILAVHAGVAIHQSHLREQLDEQRARFSAIVENAPHGVVFVETRTEDVTMNPRAEALAGQRFRTLAEYRGTVCTPDGVPVSRENWPIVRAARGEKVSAQEFLVRRPDGTEVSVLASASPVVLGDQRDGAVVLFEDISTLKELHRLREDWTSIVTHDLRQPLSVMMMYVDLLKGLAAPPDPQRLSRVAEQLHKACGRLDRLIGDLADVSRIESRRLALELRSVDLVAMARDGVERQKLLHADRPFTLRVEGSIPTVHADPVRIEQVLDNLLTNAIKYSPPGTPVDVDVRLVAEGVCVQVANQGAGISPAELPLVFDRYFRATRVRSGVAQGLGLGLFIAKGLVEAHGGRIWAESTPGETTRFQFVIPVAG